ncbi:helix-turn-helix domain-containing protein [Megamonas funiformis]|uniref:helix-turn-helix domain-containing protein n=1 Tax=Megamonas funiformis TaxID=437897 RepID=UPI003F87BE9E
MIVTRLIKLRENKALKQFEVANLLNINPVTYNRYEKGEREPDHKMLKKLAVFFNVSTDYLLGLTDIPDIIDDYIKKSNIKQTLLTNDEKELLNLYCELPLESKTTIKTLTKTQHDLYVKPKSDEKAI